MTQRHAWVMLLCLAWIIPGVVGHDPWKPDEAYTFGVVYDMLRGASWLVPTIAGEPFLDEPPLYYLTAAAFGALFSWLLPLHDAARLATAFYMALAFVFCGLAGRELHGRGNGTLTVMLVLGGFGLMVRAHQMITDVAALAGFCCAYFAFALALRRPLAAGALLGTAIGVIFLAQGIYEALMLAMLALALPLAAAPWRTRDYARTLRVATVVALPLLAIWPVLLHARSPALFDLWLQRDLFMRTLGGSHNWMFYLRILPWYAWPLWLLALWSLWCVRRTPKGEFSRAPIALPLTGFAVSLLALTFSGETRELNALPLLPALALLAAPGIAQLRRGAASAWYWFGIMGFAFFALAFWFYWVALELGVPARLHAHLHRLQPGYPPGFRIIPFAIAATFTLAWFVMIARLKRNAERPVIVWAASITVLWALVATLFIGWIDTGKSYRSVFAELRRNLPAQYQCMASRDLTDSPRAMLHYFENITTHRAESPASRRDCDLMLVQGVAKEENVPLGGWDKIWEGRRPGDKVERYRLYKRGS